MSELMAICHRPCRQNDSASVLASPTDREMAAATWNSSSACGSPVRARFSARARWPSAWIGLSRLEGRHGRSCQIHGLVHVVEPKMV